MCAAALHGGVLQVQYRVVCTAVSGEMLRVTVVSDASCPCVVFSTTRQVSEHLARRLQVKLSGEANTGAFTDKLVNEPCSSRHNEQTRYNLIQAQFLSRSEAATKETE